MAVVEMAAGEAPRMQFPMEFDWIAPNESCRTARAKAAAGWTVVIVQPQTGRPTARSARCLDHKRLVHEDSEFLVDAG